MEDSFAPLRLHLFAFGGFAVGHHHHDPAAKTPLVKLKSGLALTVKLEMRVQSHNASDKVRPLLANEITHCDSCVASPQGIHLDLEIGIGIAPALAFE